MRAAAAAPALAAAATFDEAETAAHEEPENDDEWYLAMKQQPRADAPHTDGIEDAVRRGAVATAKDADFLQSYYRSSRLHHLSTWRAEFQRQLVVQLTEMYQNKESQSSAAPAAASMRKRARSKSVLGEKAHDDEPEDNMHMSAEGASQAPGSGGGGDGDGGCAAVVDEQPRRIVAHIDMVIRTHIVFT